MKYVPTATHDPKAWIPVAAREINNLIQKKANVLNKTAAYTIEEDDDVIRGDATGAAFTVTLPSAVSFEGRSFIIKKIDASANAVTVDGAGAETIDGAATVALTVQYQSVTVLSNGSNWDII